MPEVQLAQMLLARENRAQRQRELQERYGLPLISFTMNIAGPVKNSPLIRRGFHMGREALLGELKRSGTPPVRCEELDDDTGCEGLYVVNAEAASLKRLCCAIEEHGAPGRLYDLDVLTPDGEKLDRPTPRLCLICGRPAKDCARSRSHSVPELQARTREILSGAVNQRDAEDAAAYTVRALLYEVAVTPKPGLVDRRNSGSHLDMDMYSFLASAASLPPYFSDCVMIGRETADKPAPETFASLRFPGKLAEAGMLKATGGVNTHKGAIFTLGLLCGAMGRLDREKWREPETLLAEVAAMTAGVEKELEAAEIAHTAGERFYLRYGETGVRGQAAAGFPTVQQYGLPVLENGLAAGKTQDEAGAAALLHLLAHTPDTNMIARGGYEKAAEKRKELQTLLAGTPYPDRAALEALDRDYIAENLSPGGSADLLALCWLLWFLKKEDT